MAGPFSFVIPSLEDQGWSPSLCLWWDWATDQRFTETFSSSRSQTQNPSEGKG